MGDYYSGRVNAVVFSNAAQDFYVLKMVLDLQDDDAVDMFAVRPSKQVTVRGTVPGLALDNGSWFGFEAKWERHEKYGYQLVITKAPVIKGKWTTEKASAMLVGHGVGSRVCGSLAKHFGEDFVRVLDAGDQDALARVDGVTPFAAAHVIERWRIVKAYFQTLEFLSDAGVPKTKIAQVWSMFGDRAEEVLSSDPWALVQIDGITFAHADEVALKLGLDMGSPKRVRGAALFSSKDGRGFGHLFLSSGEMSSRIRELVPDSSPESIAESLATLHKDGDLVIDRETRPGTTAIYEPWFHQLEMEGADLMRSRFDTADPLVEPPKPKGLQGAIDQAMKPYPAAMATVGPKAEAAYTADPANIIGIVTGALEDWSDGSRIQLSQQQMAGALNALVAPVSILTGLPGTGKTTTLQAVVSILKDASVPFLLCAPTGIAAKRMSSLAGAPAATIHRAFKARGWDKGGSREATYAGVVGQAPANLDASDGSGELWEYGPANPHPAQVVICDEFSMVDQHLLYRILSCTSDRCRLVFVGDAAQLPSVGAGNVLRDMLAADLFPTISLTEIFRQAETSDIVVAAHAVHRDVVPEYGRDKSSDFVLLEVRHEEKILEMVVDLAARLYEKRANFQVLSPRHAGTLGVTNLNQRLRERLNPKSAGLPEMRLGSEIVRGDDRVMVVKNDYDLGIFNGDVGKIARIDHKAGEVEVKLHGPPVLHVRIPFRKAATHLRLAYAMTVHKSQGQEYDVIVMPVVKGFAHQLQRNLFYTAITRAKQRVILLGHREAMVQAVHNNREDVRNTLFPERLLESFAGGLAASSSA